MTETTTTMLQTVATPVLKKALALAFADCYGAMAMCRALGNAAEIPAWTLCDNHTREQMVAEALSRGVRLRAIKTSVDNVTLTQSYAYKLLYPQPIKSEKVYESLRAKSKALVESTRGKGYSECFYIHREIKLIGKRTNNWYIAKHRAAKAANNSQV